MQPPPLPSSLNWGLASTWGIAHAHARNQGERTVIEWQGRFLDDHSFSGRLMEAAAKADLKNLERLRAGFPDLVKALEDYRSGTLQRELGLLMEAKA